jgi:serpin B
MMHKTEYFGYYADERIQALKMYYKGMEMSFVAVLPKAGVPLAEAGPVQAERIFDQMPGKRVIVGMPRFKIEAELGDMVKKMENLGVKRVFSPATAELGPIAAPAEGPLLVSEILHKAMIDVNEAGTEAAAATVVMMRAGGMPPKDEPPKFIADRPFRFYVMHEKTKSILFAGQFLTPARK